ncbi:zinc finger protein 511 [Neodiprion fabricii]|uniref:zinc finger protein 511 n=1 Tax=Neodiprion fabricii TaxID=2872261 RepID=UPI001ED932DD|nr:zinc finger protein 511 [Neodiprion fabricii]
MDTFLTQIGIGQRAPHDKFFEDTYKTCKIFVRKGVTIIDDEELCHEAVKEFTCNVPGCTATFQTLVDFEVHYNGSHRYICLECKKCRPSARLLDIHIEETHDSFFRVLADRQPMYQCYVSECEMKFKTLADRREHCTTVHKYPKHFRFDEGNWRKGRGDSEDQMEVDKEPRSTKLQKNIPRLNKNQKCRTFRPSDKEISSKNVPIIATLSSMVNVASPNKASSLSFVPRQVSSYSKVLSKQSNSHRDVLNNGCMMELADTLPQ